MSVRMIGAGEVMKLKESGRTVEVLDVRTPLEHAEIHAEGVRLVPLDSLDPKAVVQARNGTAEEPLYVICKSGKRAAQACEKFMEAGFTNVLCIDGGTEAWAAAGLPVVRGKTVISLERQVRIVAGLIVLISVLLGFTVHPWIFGVAGFVGAGLALAGATDFCGMGLLLARMPWNKRIGATRCAI